MGEDGDLLQKTMDPKIVLILVSMAAISQGLECKVGNWIYENQPCFYEDQDVCYKVVEGYDVTYRGCHSFRELETYFKDYAQLKLKRDECVGTWRYNVCTCS